MITRTHSPPPPSPPLPSSTFGTRRRRQQPAAARPRTQHLLQQQHELRREALAYTRRVYRAHAWHALQNSCVTSLPLGILQVRRAAAIAMLPAFPRHL